MRLPSAEAVVAALLIVGSCVLHPAPACCEGRVVAVKRMVVRGEPVLSITVGWRANPDDYEQVTALFPEDSREGVLFHEVGACVMVTRLGRRVRLERCEG